MYRQSYLRRDRAGIRLHLTTDVLSSLLEILLLANLALHLGGGGTLVWSTFLLRGLANDLACRSLLGGHSSDSCGVVVERLSG